MSLILDALRKSEAQRRRGEMPDLRAERPPTVHRIAPRRRWPLWFAGIAAAIAIVALAWGVWDRAPKTPPVPATVEIVDEAPAPATEALPAEPVVVTAPPSTAPAPPVRSTPLPGAEPPPAQPVEDDVYAAASAREPPPTATPPASTQVPSAPEPATAARTDSRYVDAFANNAASAPTVAAPSPAAAPAPVAPLPMPPPATGAAVRIADLSPGEREQLPALKISMHMFGPTPAQRFAIIDGTRVTQGDRVGEAVVEEIASDVVVLNWHGRRLSLPLR